MGFFSKLKEAFTRSNPPEPPPTFHEISQQFQTQQGQFHEIHNQFGFTFPEPPVINLMSDLHVGHATTNYKRIEDEVNAIVSKENSYVILAGDLIDNLWWNPGQMQEMAQTPDQVAYLRSLITCLTEEGKLLHSIQGDHDGWLARAGVTLNDDLIRQGVSVSSGPTYFNMEVQNSNGNQEYNMAGAHQLPGHSIYNTTHPEMRAVRFGSMHGAEVVFAGHNHKKGEATSYQHEMGRPEETHYIALGPYKATDEYLQKKGFPPQEPAEMFGVAVLLGGETHSINVVLDILKANK
jgi:hypothetical protein